MKKILNLRLALMVAISLIIGIATAYFVKMEQTFCLILFPALLGVSVILFLIFSCINKKIVSSIVITALMALFFFAGFFLFTYQLNRYESNEYGEHYYYVITGKVEDVKETERGYLLIVDDVKLNDKKYECNGKVALYYYGDNTFEIGDLVKTSGYLSSRTCIYDNRLSASNIQRDIRYVVYMYNEEGVSVTGEDRNLFDKINLLIKDTLKEGLEEEEFSVAYALLTGNSEYIDEEVITNFRSAGVAHIFAVSGLHIGFLATALSFLFTKLKFNKYLSAIIIICALFFYAGICGFSASSIRASIMCATMLIVKLFGERYDGLTGLSISAIIILLISPVQLFCVGFQLSFAVVFGIIVCSPFIKKLFKFLPDKLSGSIATVLSAYLFGIPISLYAFGEFSTIAIIVNFLFIPVVGIIYIVLLVAVILSAITTLYTIILFVPNYIFKAVIFVINIVDYKIFMVGGFTFGIFALFYYLALLLACGFINLKKIARLIVSIALAVICIVGTVTVNLVDNSKIKLYVSGSDNGCFTYVDNADEDILIISDGKSIVSTSRIKKLIEMGGEDHLVVILQNIEGIDIQVLATRLHYVANIKTLLYYGERQEAVENVIKSSFDDIAVRSFVDGDILFYEKLTFTSAIEGKCIFIKNENKTVSVFAEFGAKANYDMLSTRLDVVIACDYVDGIMAKYKPEEMISYRNNFQFDNAEREGVYIYYL